MVQDEDWEDCGGVGGRGGRMQQERGHMPSSRNGPLWRGREGSLDRLEV